MNQAIIDLENSLQLVNAKLKELLKRGSNDEKLVDKKREIQKQIRTLKKDSQWKM